MKKVTSSLLMTFMAFLTMLSFVVVPISVIAQLQQNDDGSFNIGTIDGTAKILGQESASVDLTKAAIENRTVTLDADKKTIISSEAEVNALQDDQVVTDSGGSAVVNVGLFFKDAQNSKDQAQEDIKKNIESEIEQALKSMDVQSETSGETRDLLVEKRAELFRNIDSYFQQDAAIYSPDSVSELSISINSIFKQIEDGLSGEKTDNNEEFKFETVTLTETLLAYKKTLEERQLLFENRNQQVYIDSDNDGLSDFDEIYIYKTDPNKAFTVGGKLNDKEKIIAGIDPLSVTGEKIVYEDPRLDRDAVEAPTYALLTIEFEPANESLTGKEKLVLGGTALPNSLATIYIFSVPRVITVETDNEGKWEYSLGKELENGEHTVFVSTTDNKGRLLAKSTPTLITKTSQAAVVGVLVAEAASTEADVLFDKLSFILLIGLLIIGMIVTSSLIIATRKKKVEESVFTPMHPGSTPFIQSDFVQPEITPRERNETLYPHMDIKKGSK